MWGFEDLKDLLDVLVLPLALGLLPTFIDWRRRTTFRSLIIRELEEAAPKEPPRKGPIGWTKYLKRQFIHEDIFKKPSENRDFILSLPPNLAYNLSQMWSQFEKAEVSQDPSELSEYGNLWCEYLGRVLNDLAGPHTMELKRDVLEPWRHIIVKT